MFFSAINILYQCIALRDRSNMKGSLRNVVISISRRQRNYSIPKFYINTDITGVVGWSGSCSCGMMVMVHWYMNWCIAADL